MGLLLEDGAGFCPWHGRDSSFQLAEEIAYASPTHYSQHISGFASPPDHPVRQGISVLECLHCFKTVIVLDTFMSLPKGDGGQKDVLTERTMVFPKEAPRELQQTAPIALRSLFAEASTCEKAGAFRAAGVMYRAAVEELVKDQSAQGKDLWAKIESLKGKLSEELVQDLHEARMLGNDSIHQGLTYSAAEVDDVAGLIEEAVLVLYVQPEQKRAMREARKARRESAKGQADT